MSSVFIVTLKSGQQQGGPTDETDVRKCFEIKELAGLEGKWLLYPNSRQIEFAIKLEEVAAILICQQSRIAQPSGIKLIS